MKRVLYTELGTGLGAAACYPDLARETATVVETEGRKVVDTTYSLVTGGGGEASRYVLRVFVSRFFNPGLNFPITIVLKITLEVSTFVFIQKYLKFEYNR